MQIGQMLVGAVREPHLKDIYTSIDMYRLSLKN
jgi:hypothetical protein